MTDSRALEPEPGDAQGRATSVPILFTAAVWVVCITPWLATLLGADFGLHNVPVDVGGYRGDEALADHLHRSLSGSFTHTILEWSAFCIAVITAILAVVRFHMIKDIATPIIGVALFCAGCMDAFDILAADRLIVAVADNRDLIPFTWAISRLFHAVIMVTGVGVFLVGPFGRRRFGLGFVLGVSGVFGVVAYAVVHYCATSTSLPRTQFPGSFITRPYDVVPLVLFLVAGLVVFPLFHRRHGTLFSHSLMISVVPQVATQLHMALGSQQLFDSHFNIAHFLKIGAYAVPLGGLVMDYVHTYRHAERMASTLQDEVAHARRTEQVLKHSQTRTQAILDNALDAIISIDEQGRIVEFNPAAEQIFGYRQADVLGKELAQTIIPQAYRQGHRHGLARYLTTGESHVLGKRLELSALRADGSQFPMELAVVGVHLEGRHAVFTAFMRDITERKEAVNQLQRLARGIEHAGDSIIMTDPDGTIRYVNPAFTRLTGYTAQDAVGQTPRLLKSDRCPTEFYQEMWQTLLGGDIWSGQVTNLRKDATPYDAQLTISPVSDEQGQLQGFVAVHNDITELKRTQEGLEQAIELLKEKNQEMEQFVYSVSHDLKSPIVTILGYMGYLREDANDGKATQVIESADRIEKAAHRMCHTIDDLLQLSRVGRVAFEPQELEVDPVVRSLVRELGHRLEERGVSVEVRPGLPRVWADPARLREVLENLLVNALKYGCTAPHPRITIGGTVLDGQPCVFVRDNGSGVPPAYHDKIFGLFERVHVDNEGTGIGLAIVKRTMQVHTGRVWVESPVSNPVLGEPGHGAAFWLAFPALKTGPVLVQGPA